MNIQNRMDSSLMMDRAVRKERQKLRSHTKSYRVSGQGADNSKLYDKLISKNQDADKTGTDMLVKRSRYYSISEISKEVSKKAEKLLKEKDIDKSDEQTQKEWEEDVTSFLALHNTLLNSLKRIDTDVMTKYAKELQSNAKEYEKALEEMGIVIDDSGAFSISKEWYSLTTKSGRNLSKRHRHCQKRRRQVPRAVWIPLPQTGSYMGSVIINMERKAKANKIRC